MVEETIALLQRYGDEARVLAGNLCQVRTCQYSHTPCFNSMLAQVNDTEGPLGQAPRHHHQ